MRFFSFKAPHFPKKSTAFGAMADRRSITVAALALPMPKLIKVVSSAVAQGMAFSRPTISHPFHSANFSR